MVFLINISLYAIMFSCVWLNVNLKRFRVVFSEFIKHDYRGATLGSKQEIT